MKQRKADGPECRYTLLHWGRRASTPSFFGTNYAHNLNLERRYPVCQNSDKPRLMVPTPLSIANLPTLLSASIVFPVRVESLLLKIFP